MRGSRVTGIVLLVAALHVAVVSMVFGPRHAGYMMSATLSATLIWGGVFVLSERKRRCGAVAGVVVGLAVQQVAYQIWKAAARGFLVAAGAVWGAAKPGRLGHLEVRAMRRGKGVKREGAAAHREWTSQRVAKRSVTSLGRWASVPERRKRKLRKVLAAECGHGYSDASCWQWILPSLPEGKPPRTAGLMTPTGALWRQGARVGVFCCLCTVIIWIFGGAALAARRVCCWPA